MRARYGHPKSPSPCPSEPNYPALDHGPGSPRHRVKGEDRRGRRPGGWRGGGGSRLCPSPSVCAASAACWLVAAIDSSINAARALVPPPPSSGSGSARGAGRSIRSQLPLTPPGLRSGLALWLWLSRSAFVSIPRLGVGGTDPQRFCSSLAFSLNRSDGSFFCPSSRTTLPQVLGPAELGTGGRDMSLTEQVLHAEHWFVSHRN